MANLLGVSTGWTKGRFEQEIDPAHRYRRGENDESKEKRIQGQRLKDRQGDPPSDTAALCHGHDLPGLAIAALRHLLVEPCLLQGVQSIIALAHKT